eukprot:CAMPEP_0195144780 /NCGR_PEP_ID=MMETSP0448-20130528/168696_1 /TAXON_ID=66468 /ORGANISM="Heterocapsa triquestra, Strain CCMP 448" /LENGTH=149 /DNA_ID=CAMNT_0040183267 /DNA_START=32 /DNA_END=478 /DNA_ORIENTATION=+
MAAQHSATTAAANLSLPRTLAVLQAGITDGLHYGAQISVILGDRHVDLCIGEAAPGVKMTPEHVLCWSSSVKPVMAVALAQLQEQGCLAFSDPVAKHLPAFAAKGKDAVTLAHCLTHTAGLCLARLNSERSPSENLAYLCEQPLEKDWE